MPIQRDISASLGLHLALLLLMSFWTPALLPTALDDAILPIEIITIDRLTRLTEKPTPAPAKPTDDSAVKPNTPSAHEVAPQPKPITSDAMPDLAPSDTQKTPPLAPTQVFKVANPVPVPRPTFEKTATPRPKLDIQAVRALLNKTPDSIPDTPAPSDGEREAVARLTLSEIDAFRVQMQRCWSPPSGALDADSLVVLVRLSLTPTGTISAGPVVMNRARLSDPYFRAAAESVLRAIRRCQPFRMPPEKYAAWRDIELTFDPSKMLGI